MLEKYSYQGEFTFEINQQLKKVCNAPYDKSGVYLIYENINKDDVVLIYIGRSGKVNEDGTIFIRKTGLGGMKDRIVNGHQFGKIPRHKSWRLQMESDGINKIYIDWYVTHNDEYIDSPREVESYLLKEYFNQFRQLPRWNKSF